MEKQWCTQSFCASLQFSDTNICNILFAIYNETNRTHTNIWNVSNYRWFQNMSVHFCTETN